MADTPTGPTLTKAALADEVHARVGLSKKESKEFVEETLDIIRNSLVRGERVKIAGFGNFVVRDKAARKGRNPQTNEEITIARRRVLTFKPSQLLRAALNETGDEQG